jgi:hypothetical protein
MKLASIIIAILVVNVGCSDTHRKHYELNCSYSEFKKRIDRIDDSINTMSTTAEYYSVDDFKNIFDSASYYYDHSMAFMSDSGEPNGKKIIVMYLMAALPLEDYLLYVNKLNELYKKKFINDYIFVYALINPITACPVLVMNYRNKKERRLLWKILLENQQSKEIRQAILDILSGDSCDFYSVGCDSH